MLFGPAAARVVVALFAAGAIGDLAALGPAGTDPGTGPEGVRASQLVPRMREGESRGTRTTARSV